jgi:hypothetical protein
VVTATSSYAVLTTSGISWTTGDDVGAIEVGDDVSVVGNVSDSDRDHYIKFALSESNSPFIGVYDNVDDVDDDGDLRVGIANLNGKVSGISTDEFGIFAGDSTLSGNHILLTDSQGSMRFDKFKMDTNGIDIDSEGDGLPDVNEAVSGTTASASFKSATSGSRFTSDGLEITDAQKGKYIRIKFSYSISGGDSSYDIRLRPQLQRISDNVWVDEVFSNAVKTHPTASIANFDTNSSSTITDTGTGFYSEFRLQETTSTVSGDYVIYVSASDIDYADYDNIRLSAFHQSGAEVTGSFSASVEINVYRPALGIYPTGVITRLTDTLYRDIEPSTGEYKIYQDETLIS